MRIMELKTNDEIIENPTSDDIESLVPSLEGEANHFAILGKSDMTYLQTSNWKNLGFDLEYQEGSLKRHFKTVSRLTVEQVKQAFIWYLQGDERWRSSFVWTRMDLSGGKDDGSQQEKTSDHILSEAELTVAKALQIFGLKHGATKDQLKRQYRELVSKCHPDRVNHLDTEFQKLAEEKTKLLNEAYRLLIEII